MKNLFQKLLKLKAKYELIYKRSLDNQIYEILSGYLTEQIVVNGQTARRAELDQMQKRIEENKKFINFIKKIK